jgi:GTP-binding protein
MRREGFELLVSKPEVILKDIDGVQCEPYEDLQIDVPDRYSGAGHRFPRPPFGRYAQYELR